MKKLALKELESISGGNHNVNAPFCDGIATAILAGGNVSGHALAMYLSSCSPVVI